MSTATVDIWHIELTTPPPADTVLNASEIERASRFRFEMHRRRFIAARHALRVILAGYLDANPSSLSFAYGDHGKPSVEGSPLHFNLSHSGDAAALAVSTDRELGLDIEEMRPAQDLLDVARNFFAQAEVASIAVLPLSDRPQAFYRCWTRKEAYIKARGEGLAIPLDSFTVPTGEDTGGRLLSSCLGQSELLRWNLYSLPCRPGLAGALAVESGPVQLNFQIYGVTG